MKKLQKQGSFGFQDYRKIPSLVFDCELDCGASYFETVLNDRQALDERLKLAREAVASCTVPSSPLAAELAQDVAEILRERRDLVSLAKLLASKGHEVTLRSSQGGGGGVECLRNLRHEFLLCGEQETNQVLIDVAFREQFLVAQPTDHYDALMDDVPQAFVGTRQQLLTLVKVVSQELGSCFERQGLTLPPWRQVGAQLTKWLPAKYTDTVFRVQRGMVRTRSHSKTNLHALALHMGAREGPGKSRMGDAQRIGLSVGSWQGVRTAQRRPDYPQAPYGSTGGEPGALGTVASGRASDGQFVTAAAVAAAPGLTAGMFDLQGLNFGLSDPPSRDSAGFDFLVGGRAGESGASSSAAALLSVGSRRKGGPGGVREVSCGGVRDSDGADVASFKMPKLMLDVSHQTPTGSHQHAIHLLTPVAPRRAAGDMASDAPSAAAAAGSPLNTSGSAPGAGPAAASAVTPSAWPWVRTSDGKSDNSGGNSSAGVAAVPPPLPLPPAALHASVLASLLPPPTASAFTPLPLPLPFPQPPTGGPSGTLTPPRAAPTSPTPIQAPKGYVFTTFVSSSQGPPPQTGTTPNQVPWVQLQGFPKAADSPRSPTHLGGLGGLGGQRLSTHPSPGLGPSPDRDHFGPPIPRIFWPTPAGAAGSAATSPGPTAPPNLPSSTRTSLEGAFPPRDIAATAGRRVSMPGIYYPAANPNPNPNPTPLPAASNSAGSLNPGTAAGVASGQAQIHPRLSAGTQGNLSRTLKGEGVFGPSAWTGDLSASDSRVASPPLPLPQPSSQATPGQTYTPPSAAGAVGAPVPAAAIWGAFGMSGTASRLFGQRSGASSPTPPPEHQGGLQASSGLEPQGSVRQGSAAATAGGSFRIITVRAAGSGASGAAAAPSAPLIDKTLVRKESFHHIKSLSASGIDLASLDSPKGGAAAGAAAQPGGLTSPAGGPLVRQTSRFAVAAQRRSDGYAIDMANAAAAAAAAASEEDDDDWRIPDARSPPSTTAAAVISQPGSTGPKAGPAARKSPTPARGISLEALLAGATLEGGAGAGNGDAGAASGGTGGSTSGSVRAGKGTRTPSRTPPTGSTPTPGGGDAGGADRPIPLLELFQSLRAPAVGAGATAPTSPTGSGSPFSAGPVRADGAGPQRAWQRRGSAEAIMAPRGGSGMGPPGGGGAAAAAAAAVGAARVVRVTPLQSQRPTGSSLDGGRPYIGGGIVAAGAAPGAPAFSSGASHRLPGVETHPGAAFPFPRGPAAPPRAGGSYAPQAHHRDAASIGAAGTGAVSSPLSPLSPSTPGRYSSLSGVPGTPPAAAAAAVTGSPAARSRRLLGRTSGGLMHPSRSFGELVGSPGI